jgi:CIC family chloride channel protein
MTSVLMIFEMTQDYAVIVPLMIANMVSLFIATRLQHQPIYEALAIQDGIHLPTAETRQRFGQRQIITVMQTSQNETLPDFLPVETTVRDAVEKARQAQFRTLLVTDPRGVVGIIAFSTLQAAMASSDGGDKKLSDLLDVVVFPHVHSDQGLDLALERMGANQLEILPVVNRADVHKLEGIVTLHDVLKAYGVSPHDES